MGASAFPKENASILSEEMNAEFGNFGGAKDPQSQIGVDARSPALRPPSSPSSGKFRTVAWTAVPTPANRDP